MRDRILFFFALLMLVLGFTSWYHRRRRAYEAALWESATDPLD